MPVETKKVLWTVFSVGAFLVIVLGVLLVAFYPKPGAENAPLALGLPEARGSAADRYTRPAGSAPLPEALPAQTPATDSAPVVVVPYGEKPEPGSLVPLPPAGAGSPAPTATIAATETSASGTATGDPAIKRTYVPAPSGGASKPAVVVTPESKPAAGATTSSSAKPAASTVTASAAAPKPAASVPAKSAYVDEYWIQAGSFSSRTRAEDLQALLKEKGLSSTIEAKDASSGVVYRVRIGPWERKDVADGWLATVRKVDGCADAYVSKVTRKT
ncbi:MAG: SPOR domain-containing protein [Spirochaetales bacterium]|nr:SPOR domain-containing protein [Spirochaetales bacterium]